MAAITYTKLGDNSWGLRSETALTPGTQVTVSKRDGSQKTETVGQLDREFTTVKLYRIASASASVPARKRRWVPCGYPGCSPSWCDECEGEGRYGR